MPAHGSVIGIWTPARLGYGFYKLNQNLFQEESQLFMLQKQCRMGTERKKKVQEEKAKSHGEADPSKFTLETVKVNGLERCIPSSEKSWPPDSGYYTQ